MAKRPVERLGGQYRGKARNSKLRDERPHSGDMLATGDYQHSVQASGGQITKPPSSLTSLSSSASAAVTSA